MTSNISIVCANWASSPGVNVLAMSRLILGWITNYLNNIAAGQPHESKRFANE
jgi:hypothetical protein